MFLFIVWNNSDLPKLNTFDDKQISPIYCHALFCFKFYKSWARKKKIQNLNVSHGNFHHCRPSASSENVSYAVGPFICRWRLQVFFAFHRSFAQLHALPDGCLYLPRSPAKAF